MEEDSPKLLGHDVWDGGDEFRWEQAGQGGMNERAGERKATWDRRCSPYGM